MRLHPTTIKLLDLLRSVNSEISYEAIEAYTGKTKEEFDPLLYRCRGYLERDEGIIFKVDIGVGLVRMDDGDIVNSLNGITRKLHRTAGRGIMRTHAVKDPARLSKTDKKRLAEAQDAFQAIHASTQQSDQ